MKLNFNAQVQKVTAKVDHTLTVVLNTQEMGREGGELTILTGQQVNVLFVGADEAIRPEDVPDAPEVMEDNGTSPARRQRGLLFHIWEAKGKPGQTFEFYYRHRMELNEQKLRDELDNLTV